MKWISISLLLIYFIISAGACSIAIPEYVHISSVVHTNEEGLLKVNIAQGKDYDEVELGYKIFDVEEKTLVDVEEYDGIDEATYQPHDKISPNFTIVNSTRMIINESNSEIVVSLAGENLSDIREVLVFFHSIRFGQHYLIYAPYIEGYESSGYYDEDRTRLLLIDDETGDIVSASSTDFPTHRGSDWGIQYDDQGLLQLGQGGADCVSSIFVKYTADDLAILIKVFVQDLWFVVESPDVMIQFTRYWRDNMTIINYYSYDGLLQDQMNFTEAELLELVSGDNVSVPSLVSFPLFSFLAVGMAGLVVRMKSLVHL